MSKSTNPQLATHDSPIGLVVDAGPSVGYGHAVRCMRLAKAVSEEAQVIFYPLSEACERFLRSAAPEFETRNWTFEKDSLPPFVISDLREPKAIVADQHISIHDLGLGQCRSDVVIDGSITRVFPYPEDENRTYFLGPDYMITRERVNRDSIEDTVLVTMGGGSSAAYSSMIAEYLRYMGFKVTVTNGFSWSLSTSEDQFTNAMSTCAFAISTSGVTLYELLASGVPTIAVAVDRLQLRTALAFQDEGAVLCAGLLGSLPAEALVGYCREIISNPPLAQRLARQGQQLIDGKGLSRVLDIVRRQLWLTEQTKTYTTC